MGVRVGALLGPLKGDNKREPVAPREALQHQVVVQVLERSLEREPVAPRETLQHQVVVHVLECSLEREPVAPREALQHQVVVQVLERSLEREPVAPREALKHQVVVQVLERSLEREPVAPREALQQDGPHVSAVFYRSSSMKLSRNPMSSYAISNTIIGSNRVLAAPFLMRRNSSASSISPSNEIRSIL